MSSYVCSWGPGRSLDFEGTTERTGGTQTDASFEKHADEMLMMTWQNATRKQMARQLWWITGRHLAHRPRGVTMRGEIKLNMLDNPWQYNFYSDIRKHNLLCCLPCPTSPFSMSYFNECLQLQNMSKIVYLYVKPLFLYYFLLIATMTKTMFVNSQQLLFIILFICEVITLHKIII